LHEIASADDIRHHLNQFQHNQNMRNIFKTIKHQVTLPDFQPLQTSFNPLYESFEGNGTVPHVFNYFERLGELHLAGLRRIEGFKECPSKGVRLRDISYHEFEAKVKEYLQKAGNPRAPRVFPADVPDIYRLFKVSGNEALFQFVQSMTRVTVTGCIKPKSNSNARTIRYECKLKWNEFVEAYKARQ
jgi:hypothetical protein